MGLNRDQRLRCYEVVRVLEAESGSEQRVGCDDPARLFATSASLFGRQDVLDHLLGVVGKGVLR